MRSIEKWSEVIILARVEPEEAFMAMAPGWRRQKRVDDVAAGIPERVRKVEALIGRYVQITDMPGVIAFVRGVDRAAGAALLAPIKNHGKPPATCHPDVLIEVPKPTS